MGLTEVSASGGLLPMGWLNWKAGDVGGTPASWDEVDCPPAPCPTLLASSLSPNFFPKSGALVLLERGVSAGALGLLKPVNGVLLLKFPSSGKSNLGVFFSCSVTLVGRTGAGS